MGKIMINGEQYPSYVVETGNTYVHPTTSGNKHIPSGGSDGQILRWSSDGTAVWGDEKAGAGGVTVQPTNLTFNSTNVKSGNGQYCVKNGFCTVVLNSIVFSQTVPSGNLLNITLPKPLLNLPSTNGIGASMVMDCANESNGGKNITLAVNQNGQLVTQQTSGITTDYGYAGMITYPIAE